MNFCTSTACYSQSCKMRLLSSYFCRRKITRTVASHRSLDFDIDVVPLIPFDWTHWTNDTVVRASNSICRIYRVSRGGFRVSAVETARRSRFPW